MACKAIKTACSISISPVASVGWSEPANPNIYGSVNRLLDFFRHSNLRAELIDVLMYQGQLPVTGTLKIGLGYRLKATAFRW